MNAAATIEANKVERGDTEPVADASDLLARIAAQILDDTFNGPYEGMMIVAGYSSEGSPAICYASSSDGFEVRCETRQDCLSTCGRQGLPTALS